MDIVRIGSEIVCLCEACHGPITPGRAELRTGESGGRGHLPALHAYCSERCATRGEAQFNGPQRPVRWGTFLQALSDTAEEP